MPQTDWNPRAYGLFQGLRLRPAIDLLAQIGRLPDGDVVDLGCGSGAVGPALSEWFKDRKLLGVDHSPAMRDAAAQTGVYAALEDTDIADWRAARAPALIFSNAALQWLPDHDVLMPRLAEMLAPGGTLAVQMPRQWGAPSHRFLRDIAASMFPDHFDEVQVSPVASSVYYWSLLAPYGTVSVWETDYVQRLNPVGAGHPVREFTQSTVMRSIVEKLNAQEATQFCAAYDAALGAAYPLLPDGGALLSFRRLFFTLTV
jgi:trans-aconitate 2-methyltransferase